MSEYPQSETAMLLRIEQLEEALREAQPLVAYHIISTGGMLNEGRRVLPIINAALSPSEAPEKEG